MFELAKRPDLVPYLKKKKKKSENKPEKAKGHTELKKKNQLS